MEDLSNIHWLELGIGILLGLPAAYVIGILSHVHAIRFIHFRDNRKLLKKAKTREQRWSFSIASNPSRKERETDILIILFVPALRSFLRSWHRRLFSFL
jgi:hypothetical protein